MDTYRELRVRPSLIPVTQANRACCCRLRVTPAQAAFIVPNERSLEQAQQAPEIARPFLLCADDEAVGFAMLAFDPQNEDADDRFWLWRFMIDASQQGRGFGSLMLAELLRYFRRCGADTVTLSTCAENECALRLYHRFGFRENGQKNGTELVLKLRL